MIRRIEPSEVKVGQTIGVRQRWFASGPREAFVKSYRGAVTSVGDRSVTLLDDGASMSIFMSDVTSFEAEITLLAEPMDPRRAVIEDVTREWWNAERTVTFDRLATQIIDALDKMEGK